MAKLMSDVKKEPEYGKGLAIHDQLENLSEDIDSLAKKTWTEASKIAERIRKFTWLQGKSGPLMLEKRSRVLLTELKS